MKSSRNDQCDLGDHQNLLKFRREHDVPLIKAHGEFLNCTLPHQDMAQT